ncbi:MAG: pyruvate kinase [Candidatus Omnitrophica bacterium]|nr:pyruvate kinase [Candidatus Omnitrophota bacterium]
MKRYTKIICTLGPASSNVTSIEKMVTCGMNVARVNFSHATRIEHQKMINQIRSINKNKIEILTDLEGYRIRLGPFKKKIHLGEDGRFIMSNEPYWGDNHIPFNYAGDMSRIKKGYDIFVDDGKVHLRVVGVRNKRLNVRVVQEGVLTERKGVNIPDLTLEADIMTKKDKEDVEFGIQNKVEKIAQSFVRNKRDIQRVADIVKSKLPDCQVIAKIESQAGLHNLDQILDACDGVMIARGDLGVTMPIYKIPMIQKHIVRHCNRKKKFSITATQMLDSMIENSRPTRAEVSDVANAVLDGTDYVMLSGETAVGRYPARSVNMMRQIVEYTEQHEHAML